MATMWFPRTSQCQRATSSAVLACLCAVALGAQRTPSPRKPPLPNICRNGALTGEVFSHQLSRRFSTLVGRELSGVPGAFLTVNPKDGSAVVAQSFVTGSGQVLTLTGRGSTNDGVLAVFDGGGVTPSFGGAMEFHRLSGARQGLRYNAALCEEIEAQRVRAEQAYVLRYREDSLGAARTKRIMDKLALAAKRQIVENKLSELLSVDVSQRVGLVLLRIDSLRVEHVRLDREQVLLDSLPIPEGAMEILSAVSARDSVYSTLLEKFPLDGFTFGWFSIGASVDKSRFTLLDPLLAAADQLSKRNFLTQSVQLSYSRIDQDAFQERSRYFTAAVRIGLEHNLDRLAKAEVTEREAVGAGSPERFIEKKTTAYSGSYAQNLSAARLSFDYYQFFVNGDRLAFHIFPAWTARESELSRVSLGAGLLFSGNDPAKKKSRVNAEAFVTAPNLIGGREVRPILKSLVGGIRITFPLDLIPLQ